MSRPATYRKKLQQDYRRDDLHSGPSNWWRRYLQKRLRQHWKREDKAA